MDITEMFYRKKNQKVRVYQFFKDKHLYAVIFNPTIAGNNGGHGGWEVVRARELIPMEYWDGNSGFQAKSYKNRIKDRLQIVSILLKCTDGEQFDNYNDAVAHEKLIYEAEKRKQKEEQKHDSQD